MKRDINICRKCDSFYTCRTKDKKLLLGYGCCCVDLGAVFPESVKDGTDKEKQDEYENRGVSDKCSLFVEQSMSGFNRGEKLDIKE